ncbi:MAG TPA: hypothetical protein VF571_03285 [Pyrinomonadaceae bacterium]|jgi:hypothetical protein
MAELIEEVDGSSGISRTEHALRSVLNSDIESVRQSLIHALDRIGYKVISEEPLYARRRARGWAAYYCSADILEYPIKLSIGLKQLSPNVTLATFDYVVEHFGVVSFKGDQQTLKREAEAIIALATSGATSSICTACRTKQNIEARFCRICGAPNVGGDPAELEVLRLTAGTRAGHHLITAGAIWAAVNLLVALLFIFLSAKAVGFATGFLLTQVVAGLLILFWGVYYLYRTLNPDLSKPPILPVSVRQAEFPKEAPTFLSLPAQTSVTEGTTGLLLENLKEREKEPVYPKRRDTSPIE